jgi:uncharacterized protein
LKKVAFKFTVAASNATVKLSYALQMHYWRVRQPFGVGQVVAPSVPAADFRFNDRQLSQRMLLLHDAQNADKCEYLVGVKWIKKVPQEEARWRKGAGLWAARKIVASLAQQYKTQQFLERQFGVDFKKLLNSD